MQAKKTRRTSYLMRLIGRNTYEGIADIATEFLWVILIYIGVTALALLLSCFVHWDWLSNIVSLCLGFSIPSIAFWFFLAILFDIRFEEEYIEEPYYSYRKPTSKSGIKQFFTAPKDTRQFLSIAYVIVIVFVAGLSVFYGNRYRKHYSFACSTVYYNDVHNVFHLFKNCDWVDEDEMQECEYNGTEYVEGENEEIKGYELPDDCELCPWCEEEAEDAAFEYESSRYFRK